MNIFQHSVNSFFRAAASVIAAALVISVLAEPVCSEAATYSYPNQLVDISVPDNTLVTTQSTSKYDDVWNTVGISDAGAELDEYKNMGVSAAFFNPEKRLTVKFISKRSTATAETFSFIGLNDDEITAFMSDVVTATAEDGLDVSMSVRRDLNATVPFIRMVLDARASENPCSEIIFATVINGQLLQFDAFTSGTSDPDDSFAEQVVRGVEFTRIMTPEDYDAEVRSAKIKLLIISVILIGAIAGIIVLSVFHRKRREKRMRSISDAMTDFRNRLRSGAINTSAAPRYTLSSVYDSALMDEFGVFNAWFNPEPGFALAILIFVALTVIMFIVGKLLYALLTIILVVVLLYIHYSQSEKIKEALSRRYSVKEKPTAVFKFYDEYFMVSGLPTAGEYIYGQVTAIRSFGHSVYIFVGDSQALIIRREDMGDIKVKQLRELIKK